MRAITIHNGKWSSDEGLICPAPASNETTVAVRYAGICGTDLALADGYYDFEGIPGHEFVGVAESGPLQGQRVVADINFGCRQCDLCLGGMSKHCQARNVLGIKQAPGVFAERVNVPTQNLHRVNDDLVDELAVLSEPVAAALQVLDLMPESTPEKVVVIGAGRLGLLVAHVLASAGWQVQVLVRRSARIKHLQNRDIQVVTRLSPATVPWVVDCSGSVEGFTTALSSLRPRGTLVLKSTLVDLAGVDLSPVMVKELEVRGSRCGDIDRALSWLAAGHLTPFSTQCFGFSEIDAALVAARQPEYFKILLSPER